MIFVLDLDDTLARRNCLALAPELALVAGARDFLRKYGRRTILLTAGTEALQRHKLAHLGLERSFSRICVVKTPQEKMEEIGDALRFARQSRRVLVIGDRIDCEIAAGNRLGCGTVRMHLPQGKYSRVPPRAREEIPDFVVTNFWQLLALVPLLEQTAHSSPKR